MRNAAAYSDGIRSIAWSANVAWSATKSDHRPPAGGYGAAVSDGAAPVRSTGPAAPQQETVDAQIAQGAEHGLHSPSP
jgi:hypothetical protein